MDKTEAVVQPRKAKELARLMLDDSGFRQALYDVIAEADDMIDQRVLAALQRFLKNNQVSLQLMSSNALADALATFYKKGRMTGKHIRMWV